VPCFFLDCHVERSETSLINLWDQRKNSSEILRAAQNDKNMKRLTHIDSDGRVQMVDVSAKPLSKRRAVARGKVRLQLKTLDLIARDQIAKGNVFATARVAGIQAAKQTAQLIPLCHTLPLGQVNIDIVASKDGAEVKCTAQTIAQTGVEMEALVGVTVALLTIYDMCKAVDKDMIISDVQLFEKTKSAVATVHDRRSEKTRRS
jgi:cyclic pyranopterin phosphate synthase